MKFLVDAQLPFGITKLLQEKGHDAIHTDLLPNKERTTDDEIRFICATETRILITKDNDFIDSYYLQKKPEKLILIATGNINNKKLYTVLKSNLDNILELILVNSFIEVDNNEIIAHE